MRKSLGWTHDLGGGRNLFSSSMKSPSGISGDYGGSSELLFALSETEMCETTWPLADIEKKLDSSSLVEIVPNDITIVFYYW
jgi:hypothetical protein